MSGNRSVTVANHGRCKSSCMLNTLVSLRSRADWMPEAFRWERLRPFRSAVLQSRRAGILPAYTYGVEVHFGVFRCRRPPFTLPWEELSPCRIQSGVSVVIYRFTSPNQYRQSTFNVQSWLMLTLLGNNNLPKINSRKNPIVYFSCCLLLFLK